MSGSLQKFSSVLRSSFLLFFTVSLLVRMHSSATPQDYKKEFFNRPFPRHLIVGPLEGDGGPEGDFTFGSREDQTFPEDLDSAFILEDEAQSTQLWPRVMLDYMRQQLRYRGRTKKSPKKNKVNRFLDNK